MTGGSFASNTYSAATAIQGPGGDAPTIPQGTPSYFQDRGARDRLWAEAQGQDPSIFEEACPSFKKVISLPPSFEWNMFVGACVCFPGARSSGVYFTIAGVGLAIASRMYVYLASEASETSSMAAGGLEEEEDRVGRTSARLERS